MTWISWIKLKLNVKLNVRIFFYFIVSKKWGGGKKKKKISVRSNLCRWTLSDGRQKVAWCCCTLDRFLLCIYVTVDAAVVKEKKMWETEKEFSCLFTHYFSRLYDELNIDKKKKGFNEVPGWREIIIFFFFLFSFNEIFLLSSFRWKCSTSSSRKMKR